MKFCTLVATTEFCISTVLIKKNMECISCQHSHQEYSKISRMKRQLKSLVLSTEFQFPVQRTGINNMRHTCPLFPQHWGLHYCCQLSSGHECWPALQDISQGCGKRACLPKAPSKQKGFVPVQMLPCAQLACQETATWSKRLFPPGRLAEFSSFCTVRFQNSSE